jgi:hypothetical protein
MLVFNGEDVQHLVDDGGLFKKRKTFIDKTSELSEHKIYISWEKWLPLIS